MKSPYFLLVLIFTSCLASADEMQIPLFDKSNDLLLLNFDLKTDVDDVHTIAASDLVFSHPSFSNINVLAITGTYGVQSGLYVPADELMDKVFNDKWTDAHMYLADSIKLTIEKMHDVLSTGGKVWIAEAGQSDYTAIVMRTYLSRFGSLPHSSIIVVQHSEWNEENTSADALQFVKENATYIKIPDGNITDNGSPGFNDPSFNAKNLEKIKRTSTVWSLASSISSQYNGINGRYLNETIDKGGVDFSDLVEISWILGLDTLDNTQNFFKNFLDNH